MGKKTCPLKGNKILVLSKQLMRIAINCLKVKTDFSIEGPVNMKRNSHVEKLSQLEHFKMFS